MTAIYFNLCMRGVCWVALCAWPDQLGREKKECTGLDTTHLHVVLLQWQFKLVVSWAQLT